MTRATLHLATAADAPRPTLAERIRDLQAQAKALSAEHIAEMRANVAAGIESAREVAKGGPLYPEGARQLAEKIVRDGESLLLTLDTIISRSPS